MATKKTSTKSAPARKTAAKPAKKTSSRSTAKTKSAAQTTVANEPVETPKTTTESTTPATPRKSFKIKKSYIILVGTVIVVGALLYFFRSLFVAAMVNGQPVSRLAVVQEAEKQAGQQVLNTIIRDVLIQQEARKKNITVTDKEIEEEEKKIESSFQKQGQKLDQLLAMQGETRESFRRNIRLTKMVEKMIGKDINITDKQVDDYIAQNKEALPANQSEQEIKTLVKDQLRQQELNTKYRTWLGDLNKNAKITPFVDYYNANPTNPMGN